jgi:hypothetical protein
VSVVNRRFSRADDLAALAEAASAMREAHGPEHPRHVMWQALAALMDKTAWLGRLEPDMLSRVPCDEVIAVAHEYLTASKSAEGSQS